MLVCTVLAAGKDIRPCVSVGNLMAKVRQKISGTYQNPDQSKAYCRNSSYLQLISLLGYSSLGDMQNALNGNAMELFSQSK